MNCFYLVLRRLFVDWKCFLIDLFKCYLFYIFVCILVTGTILLLEYTAIS